MKYCVAFIASALVGCAGKGASSTLAEGPPFPGVSMYDSPYLVRETAIDHPYDLAYAVERTTDEGYALTVSMKLFGGSFYVSPHSTGDFTGKFRIELASDDKLQLSANFTETPRSEEVFERHPFVDGPVNWVDEDIRYSYPLTILDQAVFDMGGTIIFTIEPWCSLEEIPVMFKYWSGLLTVEKWKC